MTVQKTVRFFVPVFIDENDQEHPFKSDFWTDLHAKVSALTISQRSTRHRGALYFGEAAVNKAPGVHYLRIGRVRTRADWPDTIDTQGLVAPLNLNDVNLFEGAYLVPFGTRAQVAMMGPIRGVVRAGAIESWIAQVLDLPAMGISVKLVPEVDQKALQKLNSAVAVARLSVKIPAGADPAFLGGPRGAVEQAIQTAIATRRDEVDVELTFSAGRRTPSQGLGSELRNAVARLIETDGPSKIEASLIIPEGNSLKRELHDFIEDTIVERVNFPVDDDHQMTPDEVLFGINEAIKEYRAR